MNSELDVFHPKLSYLIDKYKIFIIKSFNKVKESTINPMPAKNEKFSVVKDILDFFAKYNKQYKEKLDLSKILQGNEEIYNIINKISKYLLDLYFDINIDNCEEEEENENKSSDCKQINAEIDEIIEKDLGKNLFLDENEENVENINDLNFDEFYPFDKPKQKNKKRNYLEAFGKENYLKKFLNELALNKNLIDNK